VVPLLSEPLGIAMVPGGSHVLIVCADRVVSHVVSDGGAFGNEVEQWDMAGIGFAGNIGVAVDAGEAYATTTGGDVAVLSFVPAEGIVIQLASGVSPQEVAGEPNAAQFLVVGAAGGFREYDERGPLTDTVTEAGGYKGLTVSPEGSFAYASNFILNKIDVFNVFSGAPNLVTSIPTGIDPVDVTTGSAGRYIYGVTASSDLLEVYDTEGGPVLESIEPAAGRAGDLVTIQGTGFAMLPGDNTVEFWSGVMAAPDSVSPDSTTLIVTVPPGTQTGPVSVTVQGEISNLLSFRVVNRPDEGLFSIAALLDDGGPDFGDMIETPPCNLLVGVQTDGSLVAFQADPSQPDFLREVQTLAPAATGLSQAGDMAVTPDGEKLYVVDGALGQVAVFEITMDSNPLSRLGTVMDSLGVANLNADELAVTPDGRRLLVRSEGNNAIYEVETRSDTLDATGVGDSMNNFQAFPWSMAVDRRGAILWAGDNAGVNPFVLGFDLDPASLNYRQDVLSINLTSQATFGPFQIVPTPDGAAVFALLGQTAGINFQYMVSKVDSDPASTGFGTPIFTVNVALDTQPILYLNRSGTVLYVLDREAPGQLHAFDAATGVSVSGPASARLSGSGALISSLDDARLYTPALGGAFFVTDVSGATSMEISSGSGQTGLAGETFPSPIVARLVGPDPSLVEGGFIGYSTTPAGGDFGFPDQVSFGAVDASGFVSRSYTAGPAAGEDTIQVGSVIGSIVTFANVLTEAASVPPFVTSVAPGPADFPGVTTSIVADFTKAINPATVGPARLILRTRRFFTTRPTRSS
jgi:hypothetical protein